MGKPLRLACSFLSAALLLAIRPAGAAEELTFERDIRPVFRAHCYDCHGADAKVKGGLDLRLVRLAERGGDSGAALVKGDADGSLLLQRVKSGEMPPGDHRVPDQQVELLERWIRDGARTARPEPASIGPGLGVTLEERSYWAFRPIRRPPAPNSVKAAERVRTPIDAFLLARMEPEGLSFADDADKATLIRRAYLDLIGLPPTPAQVQRFLSDTSETAWPAVIDELLESPQYGERWGRHWLDVAGYADSEGYTNRDDVRPWAYKYRDWVIRAINEDMAFDQFITWQLAGDELVTPPYKNLSPRAIDMLTATGFLRMAADGTGSTNNETSRNQVVTDTIKIVSSSLLGLSVGCAQCHDHRYDPISQQDYYRLRAVFEPALDYKQWRNPTSRRISLYTDEDIAKANAIEAEAQVKAKERAKQLAEYMATALRVELDKLEQSLRKPLEDAYKTPANKRSAEQQALLKKHPNIAKLSAGVLYQYNQGHADKLKAMDAEIAKIRAKKPTQEFVRALTDPAAKPPVTKLFYRGDFRQPQHEVKPGGLTVAAPAESPLVIRDNDPSRSSTGRRLAYARWLTSGRHPLTARVLVNRIWLNHFGKTFVSTPDEFGKLGTPPTHPELLDWLSDEFMAKGWSLKHLHRLIMGSTVYRQQSQQNAQGAEKDAANQLFWHFPVRRLEAEVIRDSVLAVSGRLESDHFGAPTNVVADDSGQVIIKGDRQRRSVYLQVRRTQPVAILKSFDAPVMEVNCAVRQSSTVATQSLMLMNSEFILDFAKAFAERLDAEAKGKVPAQLVAELTVDLPKLAASARGPWRYGYGFLPEASTAGGATQVNFQPFPFFGNGQWKGGDKVPDAQLGFAFLTATGGHPQSAELATVRRWISPVTGKVVIKGRLQHSSENGDGVQLTLHSSRHGSTGQWQVKNEGVDYNVEVDVKQGDAIDAIVDRRATNTSDSFTNTFTLTHIGAPAGAARVWDSGKEFRGRSNKFAANSPITDQLAYGWQLAYGRQPTREEVEHAVNFVRQQVLLLKDHDKPVLQAVTNYCQALFGSNEFLYVD